MNINPDSEARREGARQADGKFGRQEYDEAVGGPDALPVSDGRNDALSALSDELDRNDAENDAARLTDQRAAAEARSQVGRLRKANPLHGDHYLYDTADGLRTIKIEDTGYSGQLSVSEAFHPADPPSSGWHERGTLWAPGHGPAQTGARGDQGLYSYTNAHGTFFAGTTIESAAEALVRSTRPVAADRDIEGEYTAEEARDTAAGLASEVRRDRLHNAYGGHVPHHVLSRKHEAVLELLADGKAVRADEVQAALSQVFDKYRWQSGQDGSPFDQAGRLATYIDNLD